MRFQSFFMLMTVQPFFFASASVLESAAYPAICEHLKLPCSKLQVSFDRKECGHIMIRSQSPPQAAGIALAFAVREACNAAIGSQTGLLNRF